MILFSKILENKIKKFGINSFSEETILKDKSDISKFHYQKELYSEQFMKSNHIYDEVSMTETKINDMHFRIGYPYLFRHIDHCDHIIMLCDIRLSDPYDQYIKDQKCLVTYQKKIKRRICDTCAFYYAKFISINDKLAGENSHSKVLFLCEFCVKKLQERESIDGMTYSIKKIHYYHD